MSSPTSFESTQIIERNGLKLVVLRVRDEFLQEAEVEVYLFGAHVASWKESGQPAFLFMSEKAILDGSKAIRGGIPVIFPQFSNLGSLPAHGFARTTVWEIASLQGGEGFSSVTLTTASNEKTKQVWPHDFKASFTVRLEGSHNSRLLVDWSVTNTGSAPLSFSAALHTYFNVSDISNVSVSALPVSAAADEKESKSQSQSGSESESESETGLVGVTYIDQLQEKKHLQQSDPQIKFAEEVDRIYLNTPSHLVITDRPNPSASPSESSGSQGRRIHVEKSSASMPDAVIWNPWIKKSSGMPDMAPLGYRSMVCVETAVIGADLKGCALNAGQEWRAHLKLSSSPL